MTAPSVDSARFAHAARRHHADASHLCVHGRHASADHLAGFTAECFLKAILLHFFDAKLSPKGIPISVHPGKKAIKHGHLPELWGQVAMLAAGRTGAQFAALVAGANPFAAWDVNDRYGDGAGITSSQAWQHVSAATTIGHLYQMAQIRGAIP